MAYPIFVEALRRRWAESPAPAEGVGYQAARERAYAILREIKKRMLVRSNLADLKLFIPLTEFIIDLSWDEEYEYHITFSGGGPSFFLKILAFPYSNPLVEKEFRPDDPWEEEITKMVEEFLVSRDLIRAKVG